MPPALACEGLTRRYGPRAACADVSLRVPRGGIFALLGRNGAGKSTFLRMVVGLCRPTAGSARIFGVPVGDPESRRLFGYLPEHFRYPEWATGLEVLGFHAALAGIPPARRRGRIAAALDRVGLGRDGGRRVGHYSKGMQQRLGLACALLGDPPLLLLDEPTSALDPVGRRDVRALLLGLRAEGRTVFLNSHLLSEVELVADRVAVLRAGRLVACGSPDELGRGAREAHVLLEAGDAAGRAALHHAGAVLGEEPWPGGLVRVRLAVDGPGDLPALAAAVVAAGGRLHGLQPGGRTLEDVFADLVGEAHGA